MSSFSAENVGAALAAVKKAAAGGLSASAAANIAFLVAGNPAASPVSQIEASQHQKRPFQLFLTVIPFSLASSCEHQTSIVAKDT